MLRRWRCASLFQAERKAAIDAAVVAHLDVVARQAGVGAHRAPVLRGGIPVLHHRLEDEARQVAGLVVGHLADALAVVGRDIDRGLGHDGLGGRVDGLVVDHVILT